LFLTYEHGPQHTLALRGPSINGVGKSFNGRNAENEHPRGKDEKKMEAWGRAKGKMGWREKLKKKNPRKSRKKRGSRVINGLMMMMVHHALMIENA